ncbi:hypothetical protein [Glycomyces harbinensis]|uniref:Uncharacterized protein n=1 Tax=Glycomyces harbinensis TaxID=58114 RepID=A0A1G6Z2M5_9ACTN|nr:hypothetical protein [Glycomyces harbinensis]SDD96781.1 hypothetical protein SAMN05216270_11015 [Glycomyces harbinensis]
METTPRSRGNPVLRPETLGGALAISLFATAVAMLVSGPLLPAAGAFALSALLALTVAVSAASTAVRVCGWVGVAAAWFPLAFLVPMSAVEAFDTEYTGFGESVLITVLVYAQYAALVVLFLWAAWRRPRAAADGIAGEAALILLMAWSLFLLWTDSMLDFEASDHPLVLGLIAAALLLVVAEYRAQGREIAYGAPAWVCLGSAAWILAEGGVEGGLDGDWRTALWWLLAVPVLAMVARLAWWRVRYRPRSE